MKSTPYCPIKRKRRHTISTPKTEWKKYRPDRYLYHLNYVGNVNQSDEDIFLKRLSFVFDGICGKDRGLGGVWANNQINKVTRLWPICFDNYGLDNYEYLRFIYEFDVWSIDTSLINNTWYLDPNLIDDANVHGVYAADYLYCENTIHPSALKLFTFDVRDFCFFNFELPKINFKLNPVDDINRIIKNKWGMSG